MPLSERTRNTIVGLTMLVTLGTVMYGIFLLGRFPWVSGLASYSVTLLADYANGVAPGNKVDLNGVEVGQVQSVALLQNPTTGAISVQVKLIINSTQKIPDNAQPILGRETIGTAYVSLNASRPSTKFLATDGTATLRATTADSGIIPREVFADFNTLKAELTGLSNDVRKVAVDLHALLAYATPEDVAKANPEDPNRPRENIATMVVRLNRTIGSIDSLLNDPKLQANVREIIQNIADSSRQLNDTLKTVNNTAANADKTIAEIGASARKFGDTATQASSSISATEKQITVVSTHLVDTLAALEKATNAMAKGEGTTGKLINDPRLYDSLVDLSKSLKSTTDDLDILVRKWKDEGVNLKLK